MHLLVAAYIGYKPAASQDIAEANEFVPVSPVSRAEFDAILAQHGIPNEH